MKTGTLLQVMVVSVVLSCSSAKTEENKNKSQSVEAIPIRVQSITKQDIVMPIKVTGLVASQSEVKLSFKTGGVVDAVYVREGMSIGRGQLVGKLNMSEIDAQVEQSKIQLEKAERDLNRAKNLYTDSVATLEQFQNASTGQQLVSKQLQIVEFNRQYSSIYSPVSGKVLKKYVSTGEIVSPGMPVVLIGSTDAAWVVKVGLSDKEVVQVDYGNPAKITLDAYPDEVFNGSISKIAETPNPQTGTFEVEVQIEINNHKLSSGFVAKAEIQTSKKPNVITLPISALVEADGDKGYVFVYLKDEGKVKRKQVKILSLYEDKVAVNSGIDTNEILVTEGASYLVDGVTVKVVE